MATATIVFICIRNSKRTLTEKVRNKAAILREVSRQDLLWYAMLSYFSMKVTGQSLNFQLELVSSEQDSCEVNKLKWAPPEGDSSHPKI